MNASQLFFTFYALEIFKFSFWLHTQKILALTANFWLQLQIFGSKQNQNFNFTFTILLLTVLSLITICFVRSAYQCLHPRLSSQNYFSLFFCSKSKQKNYVLLLFSCFLYSGHSVQFLFTTTFQIWKRGRYWRTRRQT